MTKTILDQLTRVVADQAVFREMSGNRVAVAPQTENACASVLQTASSRGWKVRIAQRADDSDGDIPAELILTTDQLSTISDIQPADLFATAQAGVTVTDLSARLAESGMWLATDPPGADITIGAAAATGASGSLQAGYGPLRDQILGMTVVTAMGKTIIGGGRVVKNVAGYDIPKLMIGGFGAFGLITKLHLRLRVVPKSDVTLVANGSLGEILDLKQKVERSTVGPAALELQSHEDGSWRLSLRILGSHDLVARSVDRLPHISSAHWVKQRPDDATELWALSRTNGRRGATTIRLGPNQESLEWALGQVHEVLGNGYTAVAGVRNLIRWSGNTDPESIETLRSRVAQRSVPVTVEQGPWALLDSVGHFGELRTGVAPLMCALRSTFDPANTLVVPFGAKQPELVL